MLLLCFILAFLFKTFPLRYITGEPQFGYADVDVDGDGGGDAVANDHRNVMLTRFASYHFFFTSFILFLRLLTKSIRQSKRLGSSLYFVLLLFFWLIFHLVFFYVLHHKFYPKGSSLLLIVLLCFFFSCSASLQSIRPIFVC